MICMAKQSHHQELPPPPPPTTTTTTRRTTTPTSSLINIIINNINIIINHHYHHHIYHFVPTFFPINFPYQTSTKSFFSLRSTRIGHSTRWKYQGFGRISVWLYALERRSQSVRFSQVNAFTRLVWRAQVLCCGEGCFCHFWRGFGWIYWRFMWCR